MQTYKDFYKLLGLSREASQDDIRKAHRRLVREHHPDANPGDGAAEEHFKEIQHAYEVLSEPERRRRYDEKLRAFSRGSSGRLRPRTRAGTTKETDATVDLRNLLRKLAGLSNEPSGGRKEAGSQARGEELARLARSLGLNITRLSKSVGESLKVGADGSRQKPSGVAGNPRQKRVKFKGARGKEKKVKGPKARRRRRHG
jgi:curved DNA-binding protein CbpA